MTAIRVSFTWFGTRKTLTPQQKEQAAESFGAEGQFLTAAKKVLDSRHPAFRAVTAVRHRVVTYWKGITLPYPEPGIRLIGRRDVGAFNVQMTTLKQELAEGVVELNRHYAQLRTAARERLGSLYNPLDYPASLEARKLYEVLPDEEAGAQRQVRVVDESGEDYLYPARYFRLVTLPPSLERVLRRPRRHPIAKRRPTKTPSAIRPA